MKYLSIDLETYSPLNLSKTGVYPYAAHPDFEILLFGYAVDNGPVQVVDLASGEKLPNEILAALMDPGVVKWAFNASFERVAPLPPRTITSRQFPGSCSVALLHGMGCIPWDANEPRPSSSRP